MQRQLQFGPLHDPMPSLFWTRQIAMQVAVQVCESQLAWHMPPLHDSLELQSVLEQHCVAHTHEAPLLL